MTKAEDLTTTTDDSTRFASSTSGIDTRQSCCKEDSDSSDFGNETNELVADLVGKQRHLSRKIACLADKLDAKNEAQDLSVEVAKITALLKRSDKITSEFATMIYGLVSLVEEKDRQQVVLKERVNKLEQERLVQRATSLRRRKKAGVGRGGGAAALREDDEHELLSPSSPFNISEVSFSRTVVDVSEISERGGLGDIEDGDNLRLEL